MKVIKYILFFFLLVALISCCEKAPLCVERCPGEYKTEPTKILEGKHKLRKMMWRETSSTEISTSSSYFFLGGGSSFNYSSKDGLEIVFSWEMNDGTFAISSIPINKFKVKFQKDVDVPEVVFMWKRHPDNPNHYEETRVDVIINNVVAGVIIMCNENDWPVDITLPLNKRS